MMGTPTSAASGFRCPHETRDISSSFHGGMKEVQASSRVDDTARVADDHGALWSTPGGATGFRPGGATGSSGFDLFAKVCRVVRALGRATWPFSRDNEKGAMEIPAVPAHWDSTDYWAKHGKIFSATQRDRVRGSAGQSAKHKDEPGACRIRAKPRNRNPALVRALTAAR